MAADRPGSRVAELLDGRIDNLQEEVTRGFALCATRVMADELAYRLTEALARIRTLEEQVAHLEHPSRPRTKTPR